MKDYLKSIDLDDYSPKSPRILLAPKPNNNYRIVHQLEPLDSIIYTSLIFEIAEAVEEYRIPKDKGIVHSYRIEVSTNGSLFNITNGWKNFLRKIKSLAENKNNKFVLIADITDFFNQIYIHRVNNLIVEAGRTELDQHAKVIEQFIMGLNKKTSRGIPIGPSASIILSELILADIDRKILTYTDQFTRYVDDIYIFFRTKQSAIEFMHELTKYLYSPHRLVFSSSKTKILGCKDFLEKVYKDEEYEEKLIKKAAIKARANEIMEEIIREELENMNPMKMNY